MNITENRRQFFSRSAAISIGAGAVVSAPLILTPRKAMAQSGSFPSWNPGAMTAANMSAAQAAFLQLGNGIGQGLPNPDDWLVASTAYDNLTSNLGTAGFHAASTQYLLNSPAMADPHDFHNYLVQNAGSGLPFNANDVSNWFNAVFPELNIYTNPTIQTLGLPVTHLRVAITLAKNGGSGEPSPMSPPSKSQFRINTNPANAIVNHAESSKSSLIVTPQLAAQRPMLPPDPGGGGAYCWYADWALGYLSWVGIAMAFGSVAVAPLATTLGIIGGVIWAIGKVRGC